MLVHKKLAAAAIVASTAAVAVFGGADGAPSSRSVTLGGPPSVAG